MTVYVMLVLAAVIGVPCLGAVVWRWVHARPATPRPSTEATAVNYLVQARHAEEQRRRFVAALHRQGYVEVAPGVLRSPDGSVEVDL